MKSILLALLLGLGALAQSASADIHVNVDSSSEYSGTFSFTGNAPEDYAYPVAFESLPFYPSEAQFVYGHRGVGAPSHVDSLFGSWVIGSPDDARIMHVDDNGAPFFVNVSGLYNNTANGNVVDFSLQGSDTGGAGGTFSGTFSFIVRWSQYSLDPVISSLGAISINAKGDAKKLADAIGELLDSEDSALWTDDGLHLTVKHGQDVFQEHKDSVVKLLDLIKKGYNDPQLADAISAILALDEKLAQSAIDSATAGGGAANKLATAQNEMGKAADELAKLHLDAAIDHYKNAWKAAQDSLK